MTDAGAVDWDPPFFSSPGCSWVGGGWEYILLAPALAAALYWRAVGCSSPRRPIGVAGLPFIWRPWLCTPHGMPCVSHGWLFVVVHGGGRVTLGRWGADLRGPLRSLLHQLILYAFCFPPSFLGGFFLVIFTVFSLLLFVILHSCWGGWEGLALCYWTLTNHSPT